MNYLVDYKKGYSVIDRYREGAGPAERVLKDDCIQ
jgi:hypothetical protein